MTDPTPDGDERREASIRRAPRFGVFVGLGIVVGVLVSLILTGLYPADPKVGFAATAGYFALYGIVGGALLGALVAIGFDVLSRRGTRRAVVYRDRMSQDERETPAEREREAVREDVAAEDQPDLDADSDEPFLEPVDPDTDRPGFGDQPGDPDSPTR